MAIARNNQIRFGVFLFSVRGLLNLTVSLGGILAFFKTGAAGLFSVYGEILKPSQVTPALEMASHIALNYSLISVGYGVLTIWMALHIWKGVRIALWINAVMLGITDLGFIIALIVPGYIPLGEGMIGPMITLLAVVLTYFGFRKLEEDNALEKVTAGWVPLDRRTRSRE